MRGDPSSGVTRCWRERGDKAVGTPRSSEMQGAQAPGKEGGNPGCSRLARPSKWRAGGVRPNAAECGGRQQTTRRAQGGPRQRPLADIPEGSGADAARRRAPPAARRARPPSWARKGNAPAPIRPGTSGSGVREPLHTGRSAAQARRARDQGAQEGQAGGGPVAAFVVRFPAAVVAMPFLITSVTCCHHFFNTLPKPTAAAWAQ